MKRITLLLLAMLLFTACGRNRPADTSSRLIVPTKNALPISAPSSTRSPTTSPTRTGARRSGTGFPLHEGHRHQHRHPDPLRLPQIHHLSLRIPSFAGLLHAFGRPGGHVPAAGREIRHEVLLRALRLGRVLGHGRHDLGDRGQPTRHRRGVENVRREIQQLRRLVPERRNLPCDEGRHPRLP